MIKVRIPRKAASKTVKVAAQQTPAPQAEQQAESMLEALVRINLYVSAVRTIKAAAHLDAAAWILIEGTWVLTTYRMAVDYCQPYMTADWTTGEYAGCPAVFMGRELIIAAAF
jgi:hypothetical protein